MQQSTRTQLLNLVLIAAAIALVALYYQDQRRPAMVGSSDAEATTAAAEEGVSPESLLRSTISIEAEGSVPANTPSHEAMVVGRTDLRYAWTIEGGKLESDANTSAIQWSSGPAGTARLSCECTDSKGTKVVVETKVQVEAQPQILRFESSAPAITEGSKAQLAWEAEDAKNVSLEPDNQDLTGIASRLIDVQPSRTTTYVLKATNGSGASVSRNVTVKVVPPPTIIGAHIEGTVGQGKPITLVCEFAGGRAELRQGGVALGSGDTSPLRIQVPDPAAGTSYVFMVTNEARTSVSQALNVVLTKTR